MTMGLGRITVIQGLAPENISGISVRQFLERLPPAIGMTILHGPVVINTPNGWIGHVIIAESHICLETWDNAILIEVNSCKDYDSAISVEVARDLLGLIEVVIAYEFPYGWALREARGC